MDVLQKLDAIAVRQAHVKKQQVEGLFLEPRETGQGCLGARHLVAFCLQQQLQAFANLRFVVDNQDRTFRHGLLS